MTTHLLERTQYPPQLSTKGMSIDEIKQIIASRKKIRLIPFSEDHLLAIAEQVSENVRINKEALNKFLEEMG